MVDRPGRGAGARAENSRLSHPEPSRILVSRAETQAEITLSHPSCSQLAVGGVLSPPVSQKLSFPSEILVL